MVWLFDGTKCTIWSHSRRAWTSSEARCGIRNEHGTDLFFYEASGDSKESTIPCDGDTIWSEQLQNTRIQKYPDLAAAKTAVTL